jgi:aerobic carbon-monoxide dehydrogenase medium subunit
VKPAAFEYHVPETAQDAAQMLADFGEEAKVLAGGQSLIPILALRLAAFEHLVDIQRIPEAIGIETRDHGLWVGALTRQAEIETREDIGAAVPLLSRATPFIGHFQIRNRGTVGGSIAHADPAGEYPAVALALDAEMDVVSPAGRRAVPAGEFFRGVWETALEPDDVLVGITFPTWTGRCGFAIQEFARRHGDFAIAGAVVGVELDGNDRVNRCAIGLFGVGSTPERAAAAERRALGSAVGDVVPEELGRLAMSELDSVPADLHGPAEYRTRVGAAMVARAWMAASAEALHG